MNILVVEDDMVSRNLLKTTLRQFGHTVKAFSNGADAWEEHDASPYRVIVSDWLMPELDGLDFCRRVRQRPSTEYTYFILITANVQQGNETYIEAMNAGIDDFMTKPLDRDLIWMRLKVAERILRYTTEINNLESMLPICSYCKNVRDDNNYWQKVETYLNNRTGTVFSHGVCPQCYETKVKPEIDRL